MDDTISVWPARACLVVDDVVAVVDVPHLAESLSGARPGAQPSLRCRDALRPSTTVTPRTGSNPSARPRRRRRLVQAEAVPGLRGLGRRRRIRRHARVPSTTCVRAALPHSHTHQLPLSLGAQRTPRNASDQRASSPVLSSVSEISTSPSSMRTTSHTVHPFLPTSGWPL